MSQFASALPIIHAAADAFRPPKRVSVPEGAASSLKIVQPGGYTGYWSASETPYMVEPMEMLSSRKHEAVVFVGPARSGKTMGLLDAWMTYAVTCDPGDMLITQMTQDKARDYSKTRVDRAIRHSPELSELMSIRGHDDNTHDKLFRHGMWLKIGWPSATQLSSSDYRYVGMTDYDRMPDNIDGEGSGFQLGLKRTTTYLSRGMCMVESSPGRPIVDPTHRPDTPHEAPPAQGILNLYNRGDRRRQYWPCPHCGEYFQASPGLGLFASLPDDDELLKIVRASDLSAMAKEHAVIFCPECAAGIEPKQKQPMNQRGVWLRDGQEISRDGTKSDGGIHSSIASYWQGGVSAAYQSWESLILRYLQALRSFASASDEESLRVTINTDQAMPYLPRAMREDANRGELADLAEDFPRFIVPEPARFVTLAIDVQGGQGSRFVLQAHAHGPDHEQWVIDRRDVLDSKRPGTRDSGFAQVDPAWYPEDWDVLTDLLDSTYRTTIDGEELRVAEMIVDTGGEGNKTEGDKKQGVTQNAYDWWRRLPSDKKRRVTLYKGASGKSAPPTKVTKVGSTGSKRRANDVPLLLCNPNLLKDAMFNGARRPESGPAKIHFPTWLGASFWDEMRAEIRNSDGTWKKVRARNEAIDLCAMTRALVLHMQTRRTRRLNWDSPPPWAQPVESNAMRESSDQRRARTEPNHDAPKPARKPAGIGKSEWSNSL